MKYIFTVAAIWCVLGVACRDPAKIPSDIIQVPLMKGILEDMLEASAYVNTQVKVDSAGQRQKQMKVLYQQILMLHHISRQQFMKSYHYYESHPDQMQTLYNSMSTDVIALRHVTDSTMMAQMDSIRKSRLDSLARTKSDSIKKIER
jgi:hypothetical protein